MPATLTTVDALLKEVYGPRLENQLQNEVIGLKRIERTSEGVTNHVGGKYVDFPIKVKRNNGIGYRAEGGQLPAAGQQGYAAVHVPLKYGYGRVRFTGQTMQLAQTNEQAFASAMEQENEGLKDDLAKDSGQVFYRDGSGLLASLTGTETSATHTVDNTAGIEIGEAVDVLVRSSGSSTGGLVNTTVVSIVDDTSITFGSSFTSTALMGVYRTGNYGNEPTGLARIVDDDTVLHTVDPAVQPKWAAVVKDNGGTPRALSEGLMIQTCDAVRQNGGKVTAIFTSLGVRRAYFNLLTQQRRYTDTKSFAGGFQGLPFNYGTEVPVVEDVDAPANTMYFLDEKKFRIYQSRDWHWADDEGHVLKWVTDFDSWEAVMRKYWEIGTSQRNAHAVLQDIIEG